MGDGTTVVFQYYFQAENSGYIVKLSVQEVDRQLNKKNRCFPLYIAALF